MVGESSPYGRRHGGEVDVPRFPRLDLLLGVPVEEWTEQQLEQAIREAVREDADLDWKQQPYAAYRGVSEEVGKDIAALANAGGGVLMFWRA